MLKLVSKYSLRHLRVFTVDELVKFFKLKPSEAYRLLIEVRKIEPLEPISLNLLRLDYRVSVGVYGFYGEYEQLLDFDPDPLLAPSLVNEEFLNYLLFDLPQVLDYDRRPVLVLNFDERFSKWILEGLNYSLSILKRISVAYSVPVVVCCRKYIKLDTRADFIVYKRGEKTLVQVLPENSVLELK